MPATKKQAFRGGSVSVAAGILVSRMVGLVRQSVFAHYFGSSDAADVFNAGFRIPNLLQNLFGEGALSASFIPVYARLRAGGDEEGARRVAGATGAIFALGLALAVLAGVFATPWILGLVAPGFSGEKREATIRIVQIFFPGAGLLVLSAWCLGVLNSHRRFFLSYAAPVVWSGAIIAALLLFGRTESGYRLGEIAAWASVAGSALQCLVQLPAVLALVGGLRVSPGAAAGHVREVFRNLLPAVMSRGVVQISAYVDILLASFLPGGAVSTLAYAQVIYTLPVSLFGMSVSAAELPEMSSASAAGRTPEMHAALRKRLEAGLGRIAFFVVPSVAAFLVLGDRIASLLFRHGAFTAGDARWVWGTLAGAAVGLVASTFGRLYSSAYFALGDTRSPFRFALARVLLTIGLGWAFALVLPGALGLDPKWGTAGLALSSGLAGWIEFALLRRGLNARIGRTGVPAVRVARLWVIALAAACAGAGVALAAAPLVAPHPLVEAALALAVFGGCYLGLAWITGEREILRRVFGRA